MENKYKSRTLYLTAYCLALLTVALFTKYISGQEAITGITIVLGVWAGQDAYKKKHTGDAS